MPLRRPGIDAMAEFSTVVPTSSLPSNKRSVRGSNRELARETQGPSTAGLAEDGTARIPNFDLPGACQSEVQQEHQDGDPETYRQEAPNQSLRIESPQSVSAAPSQKLEWTASKARPARAASYQSVSPVEGETARAGGNQSSSVASRREQTATKQSVLTLPSQEAEQAASSRQSILTLPSAPASPEAERAASKQSSLRAELESAQAASKQSALKLSGSTRAQNSFTVAKVVLSQSTKACDRLEFAEAIEPAMQRYLEDCCSDGPSAWVRSARTAGVVLCLLFFLPLLSFMPLLIPFSAPHEGFLSNWAFNFVAHPILNYVPARTQLELLSRAIEPTERHRLRSIVLWVPLVECVVCLLIHGIASLFGIFPLPYAALTSCLPGILASLIVAKQLTPKDLLTPDILRFMKFLMLTWIVWAVQFVVLLGYLMVFPLLSAIQQALLSGFVGGMLAGFGFAMEMVAVWMGLPKYHATELKPMLYFISFFFTAVLFAAAKNMWVFMFMLLQDAGKALAILCKIWIFLSQYYVRPVDSDEENAVGTALSQTQKCCQRCFSFRSIKSMSITKASTVAETIQRLRGILTEFQWHTRESLQRETIRAADARLLAHFVRFLVLFCMVELCEILVPLIYIIVITLIHIPEVGQNRQYLYVVKDMSLEAALLGNFLAFLIEVFVFLATQVFVLRTLGFNLWYFAGTVLRMDFWYWTFAFSTCCIAWTIVLIAHAGHDLESVRSWLSF